MNTYKSLRPILWTEKMAESIEFYTEILGFKVNEYNEEWNWASLSKDEVGLMLAKPNDHVANTKISFSGSFYFLVENADEIWSNLHQTAKICYEIENFPWQMREFAIYDVNGYILQFGHELKQ